MMKPAPGGDDEMDESEPYYYHHWCCNRNGFCDGACLEQED